MGSKNDEALNQERDRFHLVATERNHLEVHLAKSHRGAYWNPEVKPSPLYKIPILFTLWGEMLKRL
jgi:hypothetical protein